MPDQSQGLICGIYSNLLSKSQDLMHEQLQSTGA